jgi:hypothetical protein
VEPSTLGSRWAGAVVASTAGAGVVLCWCGTSWWCLVVGDGSGTLLGPEESGAGELDGFLVAGFLVVVWLLDSGREHLL